MAYTLPNEPSPSGGFKNAVDLYSLMKKLRLAQEQSQRMEMQNQRAEKLQPYTIEHLLAQTQGLKGSESRANQMLSPQLQALKDAHAAAVRKADPNYEINQFMKTMNALGKMGKGEAPNQENANPNLDALKAKMTGQPAMNGTGMMPMPGQENPAAQNPMAAMQDQEQGIGGASNNEPEQPMMDLNNLNPLQKMFLAQSKYKDILKPLPQTPEQKFNDFVKKEEYKAAHAAKESPEEREAREIRTADAKEQAKHRIKVNDKIKEHAQPVLAAAEHILAIEKLIKEHPGVTGIGNETLSNIPGIGKFYDAETIKAINAHAIPLQGEIAKQLSGRGGYGVAKIAESAKPSTSATTKANIGSIRANKESILKSLEQMTKEWEDANPDKPFPYPIPKGLYEDAFAENKKVEKRTIDGRNFEREEGGDWHEIH